MPPLRSRSRTSTSSLTRSSRTSRRLSRSSLSRRRPTRRGRRTRRKWASRWRAAPEKHWRVVFSPQARSVWKFYNSNFEIYWIKIVSSLKLCGGAKSLKLSHQLCNGELSLTEEEKRTLVSEGISYSIFGILVFLAIPTLFLVSKVLSIRIFCFFCLISQIFSSTLLYLPFDNFGMYFFVCMINSHCPQFSCHCPNKSEFCQTTQY